MLWKEKVDKWQNSNAVPIYLKEELESLNSDILFDSFYRYLEFGTGGMRGEIGPGTNRINLVMIRRVTVALANYILANDGQSAGVVIAYDNRHFSKEFAEETAKVFAYYGVKVYLSDFIRPTPIVSLAVREFKAFAGVMITASHNPKQYNGYKIYDASGGQITLETANEITKILNEIEDETDLDFDLDNQGISNLINHFGSEIDELYLSKLRTVTVNTDLVKDEGEKVKILYTPLHGSGQYLVLNGLLEAGFLDSHLLQEQADYDSNFSTVDYPNPEEAEVFQLAIQKGDVISADILLATDPDSDRLGVAVRNGLRYQLLTGNEIGVLMLYYLAQHNQLANSQVVKTIVTSDLGKKIAKAYQLNMTETLTGFKFIGEKIEDFEQSKLPFLFGYEESYGYLIKPYVRDKDAIQAAILLAEMALFYKLKNKTLLDVLDEIAKEYGYYKEELVTKTYYGAEASQFLVEQMSYIEANLPSYIGEMQVVRVQNYNKSLDLDVMSGVTKDIQLPQSNVLKLFLEDDSWVCIRPSGTEPKCKVYFSVNGRSQSEASEKLTQLSTDFLVYFEDVSRLLATRKTKR